MCQRVGKSSCHDELLRHPVCALQILEKWAIDFICLINSLTHHTQESYIIMVTEYLMRWVEAALVRYYTTDTTTRFIFENIISRFGCPRSLISNQGTHFINETVTSLLQNFLIQHHKRIPYHPQANGTVGAFNKTLKKGLYKVCSENWDDWDKRVPATLWAYHTIVKILHKQMPL